MKIAIPDWQGRISPVFDVASVLVVVEIEEGQIFERHTAVLHSEDLHSRVQHMAALGIDVLICGAISWPLELALSGVGIEVISQTCGEVECVLTSFATGKLSKDAFLMPGCCGRRRQFRVQRHKRQSQRLDQLSSNTKRKH